MDLRRKDFDDILAQAKIWKTTPGAELEIAMQRLDITGWQDIIHGLRSLGMRESPQLLKLNICLQNNIRFTLEGAGVIQAYCEDNRISDKPFTVMVKEAIAEAKPADITLYDIKSKIKREIPLATDDARVKEALSRWESQIKYFRMIQRFEFVAPNGLGLRFDISVIRSGGSNTTRTFQEARVSSQPSVYEAEVELTAGRDSLTPEAATALMIRGTVWMLQGIQRSYVLVSMPAARYVTDSLSQIFKTGRGFRYPGPQPATLERQNMETLQEPGVASLLKTGYNVTDKADGLRCLLFVAENGRIFLVDGGGRVYATGKEAAKELAGLVLDGEWVRKGKGRMGQSVSYFYAFDILAMRGDTKVAALPFLVPGNLKVDTRHAAMSGAVSGLATARQIIKVPVAQELQIGIKTFRVAENIFRDAAAIVLDDAKSAPYVTDGLIFTPNADPLPIGRGTWAAQLKWKPASHNTIDFLVIIDKERGADGTPTEVDLIATKVREDSGTVVQHKTLRLFVGSKRDAAFADPRKTVTSGEPLPASLDDGEYRAVEFRPSEPRDPMAAICYVAIGEGGNDPAGAAPAATRLDIPSDIMCTSGDVIQSNMIVEMAYYPERAPGWRWVPMRIRHDKTERLQRSLSGTMNADWVANSIWSSLHNPVTEEMIKTGVIQECIVPTPGKAVYYNRKAPRRDLMKTQCLRNFHNDYVKRDLLLKKTLQTGGTLCDLAMGKAGDLHKWIALGASYVFGCDYAANGINDPQDGAYARLLTKMIEMGGRDHVAPMVFVQADAAVPLKSPDAGITAEDKILIRQEFDTGRASQGFDVVSCMFALHYMFRDEVTLHGFLTNLADTVKVGGYFVGCGFDGDAVAAMLTGQESMTGRDGDTDIWTVTKRYGSAVLAANETGLGLAVDVDFISIGETHTEYLVSWEYLKTKAAEIGLELLSSEDQKALGLSASSQMFRETLESAGKRYDMSEALKRYSFLNRWYIFKRVEDKRPVPLTYEARIPKPPILTQTMLSSEKPALIEEAPKLVVSELAVEKEADMPTAEPYLIDPTLEDSRLDPENKDWPRYLSLGMLVPEGLTDQVAPNPSSIGGGQTVPIKRAVFYPSVEAGIAAAKYQIATDKPELGPQIFGLEGTLHQKFESERQRLAGNDAAMKKTVDDQVAQTRVLSGKAKIKGFKAAWDQEAWDTGKEVVYKKYLRERFRLDERFKDLASRVVKLTKENPVTAQDGTVYREPILVNGTDPSELGVGVRGGVLVGGQNKVGKWIAELIEP
jgi:hypothetical protein